MAVNNRTEAISKVNEKIVPKVTNTIHKDLLNNNILNSIVFRKDVIQSFTPVAGSVQIDYANCDTAIVLTTSTLSVSFTNLENGDVKYLRVSKNSNNAVNFSGASELTEYKDYITAKVNFCLYVVYNKNGVIYVKALNKSIDIGTAGDIFSEADLYKIPSCQAVNQACVSYYNASVAELQAYTANTGGWIVPDRGDYSNNGIVKYRKTFDNYFELIVYNVKRNAQPSNTIYILAGSEMDYVPDFLKVTNQQIWYQSVKSYAGDNILALRYDSNGGSLYLDYTQALPSENYVSFFVKLPLFTV